MGGGGKKGGRPVYDFLMSVDYGVCWGPVDRIARCVIKDKNVFCGDVTENGYAPINQPDLWGGDDGEGGPVGIIECYLGGDNQTSSAALATRFNRTPANMWGYQGMCHLFFRGGSVGVGAFTVDGNFDGTPKPFPATVSAADRKGFRWSSNNPYMPETKVTVQMLPRLLGDSNHELYPINGVAGDGSWEPAELYVTDEVGATALIQRGGLGEPNASGYNNVVLGSDSGSMTSASHPPQDVFDLLSIFPNQAEIDKAFAVGSITAFVRLTGYGNSRFIVGGPGPAQIQKACQIGFWRDNGGSFDNTVNQFVAGRGYVSLSTGAYDHTYTFQNGDTSYPLGATGIRYITTREIYYPAGWQNMGWDSVMEPPGSDTPRVGRRAQLGAVYNKISINYCQPDGELGPMPNANPAHMIYEALVNEDWGKGEDPALIDTASFTAAAQTFADEQFGLSLIWTAQDEIEKYIQTILDHVKASLFVHPRTGLFTIKPFRADYDLTGEPTINPSNATMMNAKRRAWGETINEIIVEWTEPKQEETATESSIDETNISIQGGIVSDTRQYFGIRDQYLAKWVADRDLREAAYPIFSCELYIDRSRWDVVPGQVLPLEWPDEDITFMAVRVMNIDYGKPGDRKIKLAVSEDIFALEQTEYAPPQEPQWVSVRNPAEALDEEFVFTSPMPLVIANGVDPVEFDADYPIVPLVAFGWHDTSPVIDMQLWGDVTLGDGSTTTDALATVPPTRSVLLTVALAASEDTSILPGETVELLRYSAQQPGDLLLLGTSEAVQEIIMLVSYDDVADEWTVARGIWDTIPEEWSIGDRIWNLPQNTARLDPNERSSGDALTYRFLPRMSEGRLVYDDAADVAITASDRPHQPFRPADTEIEGNGFATADFTDGSAPDPISLTWANRNRLTEDSVYQKWQDANVTPEAGQTTTIRIYDALDDSLAHEVTGLTGTSTTVALSNFPSYSYVEFVSVRDGFESFRSPRRYIDLREGYGDNYGNDYGP